MLKKNLIIALFFMSLTAFSNTLTKSYDKYLISGNEVSLFKLVKDYSKLDNLNLIINSDLKDKNINIYGNKKFTKENFEKFISSQLYQNEMGLIHDNEKDYYELVKLRDVFYKKLDLYEDKNKIPDNNYYVRFLYRLKYIKGSDLVRYLRPFLSRYGRVLDLKPNNRIAISEIGLGLKNMIKVIEMIDTPDTVKTQNELIKFNKEMKKISSYKENIWSQISKNHGYFIILFSLIFLVIGFIFRGYLIRRIEGGL